MYKNAIYVLPMFSTTPSGIRVDINDVTSFVPLNENNTDYVNIMKLVEEGKLTIAEPESEETTK